MSTRFNLTNLIGRYLGRRLFHGRPPDGRSDKDLLRVMARFSHIPGGLESEQYLDAKLESDRRAWFLEFWTHGIVSWIALVLSVVSIIVSVVVAFLK